MIIPIEKSKTVGGESRRMDGGKGTVYTRVVTVGLSDRSVWAETGRM